MDRPIIFQRDMVRALLGGRKTQTRRVLPEGKDPKIRVGDRLWVREQFGYNKSGKVWYWANGAEPKYHINKVSPIFMPRWASRLTLIVTYVKVELLQDISDDDAIREGVNCRQEFKELWNKIHTKKGKKWEDNPRVTVLSFDVHKGNIDEIGENK